MRIPIIRIKDGDYSRIAGTNIHDCLYIENNAIHYLNLQCMEGTRYGEMKFEGVETSEWSSIYSPTVEMVTVEEFIEMAIKNCEEYAESELQLQEFLEKYLEAKKKAIEKTKDVPFNTSGLLI